MDNHVSPVCCDTFNTILSDLRPAECCIDYQVQPTYITVGRYTLLGNYV